MLSRRCTGRLILALLSCLAGCEAGPPKIDDPMATLRTIESGPRAQIAAMEMLDERGPDDAVYLAALERTVWRAGYTVEAREAAVDRLAERDLPGLMRTLRQQLPRMNAWAGVTRICEIIADEGWVELTPALVSSWGRPVASVRDETERPEYKALARLHGADRVQAVVFETFLTSNRPSQQGLRTRCWELLHRLGDRDLLIELLVASDIEDDDLFLLDLRAAARDLDIVPHNREEILWVRKLRQPERAAFWDEATIAIAALPATRRAGLKMRDVAVVVSAARHEPDLLTYSTDDLYTRLDVIVRDQKHYSGAGNYSDAARITRDRLFHWRNEVTWGDLAAMLIAVRALSVPEVVAHLFDYAERDRVDESTEYGGVIALDALGRFEIIEFLPRIRHHDQKFLASQAMMDASYTSLFHFHFHAQRHWSRPHAGPGFGDRNYADNTRANCLVLTFVDEGVLNVDFYRHDGLVVDLGTITREGT